MSSKCEYKRDNVYGVRCLGILQALAVVPILLTVAFEDGVHHRRQVSCMPWGYDF